MEIPLPQAQGIMIYLNRRRAIFVTGITMLICVLFLGMDVFAIWAFWK